MNLRKVRIGILGGTFDPIHNGHIQLAKEAISVGNLDRVLFLVSKMPPHKSTCASDQQRFTMVQLALQGESKLEVCDIEIQREGKSYTADSVNLLRKKFPEAELFYIIGSDVLPTIPYWYEGEKVFSEVEFMCFRRSGGFHFYGNPIQEFTAEQKRKVRFFEVSIPDISSKEIRERLKNGLPCAEISPAVAAYMKREKLYT